ncbi:MAG TPA: SemiSWEET family transporter [Methanocella sp.]|nr:SemiSWEET family transporter [Methanocella sp.]
MDGIFIMGLVAGALTTGSTIPQIIKIIQNKSSGDISTLFFMIMATGMLLWLGYGILRSDLVIMIWNALSLSLCILILALKRIYP